MALASANEGGEAAAAVQGKNKHAAEYAAFVAAADKSAGVPEAAVAALRAEHGWNELEEKKRSALLLFLSFFWGPMPCMIWVRVHSCARADGATCGAQVLTSPSSPPYLSRCLSFVRAGGHHH